LRYEIEQHPEIGTYHETDANDDPAKQISDTEDLLTRGCDVLILSPATQDALTPIAQKAMEQGVPVVTLDRNVSDPNAYVTYVTSDNCEMGKEQAEWLADTLNDEGQIMLLAGLAGASPAEERLRCAREVFEGYPNIEVLAEAYSGWSPVEGKQIMENWITTYGDQIEGVWSGSGLQASGAIEAFVEAGMDVPPITGEDFNRYFKLWDDLGFEGVSVSFPVRQGREAVKVALDILNGEPVPHTLDVPRTIVTQENLDQYVRHDLPDDYWADSDPEVVERLFPSQ
jgi:ribose transport system substrate-binding protein